MPRKDGFPTDQGTRVPTKAGADLGGFPSDGLSGRLPLRDVQPGAGSPHAAPRPVSGEEDWSRIEGPIYLIRYPSLAGMGDALLEQAMRVSDDQRVLRRALGGPR